MCSKEHSKEHQMGHHKSQVESWRKRQNEQFASKPEQQVPTDVSETVDREVLCKWLSLYTARSRRGTRPALRIYHVFYLESSEHILETNSQPKQSGEDSILSRPWNGTLPFRLMGAQSSFQCLMDNILRRLSFVTIYMDNILVHPG